MKNYLIWLVKYISKILVLVTIIPLAFSYLLKEKETDKQMVDNNQRVAVVEVVGAIMDTTLVVKELHKFANDPSIDGIVLRVDSPGGAVGPSQDINSTVAKLKTIKPIVVSMGSVAASGGLYASLNASKIYAQSGTQTGSIGVIIQIPNFNQLADKYKVEFHTFKSGELKDVGNPTREMKPEDKAFLQSTVNVISEQFIADVAAGRNLEIEKVREFADGRLILGSQALDLGLIDEIGDLYSASRGVYDILRKPLPAGTYPKLVYTNNSISKLKQAFSATLAIPLKLLSNSYHLKHRPEAFLY